MLSSGVDFWIGTGILEMRENERIIPHITSQKQSQLIGEQIKIIQTGIEIIPSLRIIPVFKGKLDYS
jgi:hypothetical protein